MPRAWYSYNGGSFDQLSNYSLLGSEPACDTGNLICAIYAIGTKTAGVQSNNPTRITYPRSLFGAAISDGVNQPVNGGHNELGLPYYVKVKS